MRKIYITLIAFLLSCSQDYHSYKKLMAPVIKVKLASYEGMKFDGEVEPSLSI